MCGCRKNKQRQNANPLPTNTQGTNEKLVNQFARQNTLNQQTQQKMIAGKYKTAK